MKRKGRSLDDIVGDVVSDSVKIYGDRLVSVTLYGSAARGEYRPGRSDINILIVLDAKGILDLEDAFDAVRRWRRDGVDIPLFLTERYIAGALDAYPIEFLDMKVAHSTVHGSDPLENLVIDRDAVRLQAERNARGWLLRLRRGYLESGGNSHSLHALARESLPAFHALFRGLLWLDRGESGGSPMETMRRVCDRFDLKYALFEDLEEIRLGGKRRAGDMLALFDSYLEEVRKLVLILDDFDTPNREVRT